MARRRLSPTVTSPAENVPRAEHSGQGSALKASFSPAPIARVAGDAAESAALAEVTREVTQARESGRLVIELPLEDIAPDYLTRDRIPVEDEEMAALRTSIRTHGQRTPIEVTPLGTDGRAEGSTLPYGLISGWRRLAALKALFAETGEARFATVQALIRRPETAQAAYVAMVEENEIRVGLSQYERARVAALSVQRGIFETEKAALLSLFATASRPKRSRIRSFLEIYHALDAHLRFPAHLPERLGLKLVEMIRAGGSEEITRALDQGNPQTPEAELEILENLLQPAPTKPQPARTAASSEPEPDCILPDVTLEQSLSGSTLTLKLRGKGVTPALADEIRTVLRSLRTEI
ncbi:ParB/RepB/Spo0J family partition protein [Amaricoccus macauensis]|uniref:ParB/RepB/Spo0J family partition protein n=1 Tax=Amaricoccus macauensis TaxID=57001 RepID=UPI003C7DC6D1